MAQCCTPWGQWARKLLRYSAAVLGAVGSVIPAATAALGAGTKPLNSCRTFPPYLGVVDSQTSISTLPDFLGAVGNAAVSGQWALEFLRYTAAVPCGTGPWNSCGTLPRCFGAVGFRTHAVHCRIVLGHWVVELPRYIAALLGALGRGTFALHYRTARHWAVELQRYMPQCVRAVCSGTLATHYHTTLGQCVDSGNPRQRKSCSSTLLYFLGTEGNGTRAVRYCTAWEQWAVELLRYTAALCGPRGNAVVYLAVPPPLAPGVCGGEPQDFHYGCRAIRCCIIWGSGPWNSCATEPHCLGAVCSGTLAVHRHTTRWRRAVELLRHTAALSTGSGQRNAIGTLPRTALGQWAWNSCGTPPYY